MLLFWFSVPFVVIAVVQMLVVARVFLLKSKVMPNYIQHINSWSKSKFKNWQIALVSIFALAIGVALFVVYAAPFPFSFAYFFSAMLSAMLYASKLQISIYRALLWFPLMPFCWFKA